MNREFDLPAVLTELLYGDESTEPLERTLDRLVTPDFVQRINGPSASSRSPGRSRIGAARIC